MFTSLALLPTILLLQSTQPASRPSESDPGSVEIARRVVAASGDWSTVKRLKFTFNVENEGKLVLSRSHDWDVAAGTNTVTVNGQSTTVDLATRDNAEAFAAWTNDSYWLLAPLKLLDPGVILGPATTTRDYPPSLANLTMSFANVGLTPGDQYDLSIDLRTNRLTHWTYRPNAEKSIGFTWDGYQEFNGLTLSTEHKTDDGKRRIYFTGVEVGR